jgi:hypothetical protein
VPGSEDLTTDSHELIGAASSSSQGGNPLGGTGSYVDTATKVAMSKLGLHHINQPSGSFQSSV